MLVAVAVGAALPLVRNHIFYFWDDSAGAAVPVWHRIAQSVRRVVGKWVGETYRRRPMIVPTVLPV